MKLRLMVGPECSPRWRGTAWRKQCGRPSTMMSGRSDQRSDNAASDLRRMWRYSQVAEDFSGNLLDNPADCDADGDLDNGLNFAPPLQKAILHHASQCGCVESRLFSLAVQFTGRQQLQQGHRARRFWVVDDRAQPRARQAVPDTERTCRCKRLVLFQMWCGYLAAPEESYGVGPVEPRGPQAAYDSHTSHGRVQGAPVPQADTAASSCQQPRTGLRCGRQGWWPRLLPDVA